MSRSGLKLKEDSVYVPDSFFYLRYHINLTGCVRQFLIIRDAAIKTLAALQFNRKYFMMVWKQTLTYYLAG